MARKTSYVQALGEASPTRKEKLGTIREEGEKVFKYIQYDVGAGSVAGTAGRMVAYRNVAGGAGYTGSLVTADVSDGNGVPAGQLMATLLDDEFGWMQILGISNTLNVDVVSGAAGNPMVMSTTTDGTLKVKAAVTEAEAGILLVATGGAQRVLLSCLR